MRKQINGDACIKYGKRSADLRKIEERKVGRGTFDCDVLLVKKKE